MTNKKSLELVASAPPNIPAPKGPIVNVAWIIRHYHTDPDTGEQLVSGKWVRGHVPGKIRLSHSVVGWYRDEVIAHYAGLRRQSA